MASPQIHRATILLLASALLSSIICFAIDASTIPPPNSFDLCNSTLYPEACRKDLVVSVSENDLRSLHNATVQKLASITLRAALEIVHKSHALAKTCLKRKVQQGLHLLELQAVEDCEILMDSARDQLNLAIENLMSSTNTTNSRSERAAAFLDLNVRLSTALSFQTTCSDGFQFVRSGKCEKLILEAQGQVSEVLLNSLNLVKKLCKHEQRISKWEGRSTMSWANTHHRDHTKGNLNEDNIIHGTPSTHDAVEGTVRRRMKDAESGKNNAPDNINERVSESGEVTRQVAINAARNTTIVSKGDVRAGKKRRQKGDDAGRVRAQANNRSRGRDEFPEWVSYKDRKLLMQGMMSADVVVAMDGSGHYRSITEALESMQLNNYSTGNNGSALAATVLGVQRRVVYIKQGIYNETFEVPKTLPNMTFLGDGINLTIITGNNNVASGLFNTFRTSTVGILADGFMARGITFQNTAGPQGYQAVALKVSGDMAVFYRCSFEGYQDTLYALAGRQFYRDCKIYGTVDFIFGNAIASFQTCDILARKPLPFQKNTMTAQGRRVSDDISGFSFQNCSFHGAEDMASGNSSYPVQTYLGRPWKAFSRTVILQSFLGAIIEAAGWLPWNASNPFSDTVYYGEYQNYGPGSSTSSRVTWLGVHPALNASEALQFTADNFISGSSWLPLSQVSYTSGLSSDSQH